MEAWTWVLIWWLAFAGSHLLLSSLRVRRTLVGLVGGEGPFAGLYSLVALAFFVPLVWTFSRHFHEGPLLWSMRDIPAVHAGAMILSALGLTLVVAALAQPSATGMDPRAVPRARGLSRITRHPLFAGLALWGLAHVLVNGFLVDVLFFGGFLVFGVVGATHQDSRKLTEQAQRLGPFYDETSLFPFGAILTRRNRLVLSELPWLALAIGALIAVVVYLLHPVLFT